MSLIDKLRRTVNWESALVIIFYLGCLTAIIIIAIDKGNELVYIGGLIAIGIPTSFFGALSHKTNNPGEKKVIDDEQLLNIEKAIAELSSFVVDMKTELVSLSSIDLDNNTSIHNNNNIGEKENE